MLTSNFKYDAADQLVEASVPSVSSVVKEFVYRYDKAGNRTSEQVDSTSLAHTINTLNQVTAIAAGGPIRFEGSLNEPGTVTVDGVAAEVAGDDTFKADVPLTPGTPLVTVAATDAASNNASQNYDVPVGSASSRTLTYDLNGNMLSNGAGQTYTWDSADRMTKITYAGGESTEFAYDGLGRRVKIVEKNSGGSVTSEKRFVWDGMTIAEERDGSNALTKRFYGQGVMVGGDGFYYITDHLGSIREVTDDTGTIEARYDYDAYGRVTKVTGSGEADFRYTGHYFHATSDLHLAPYRIYDADLGRWLSRDPITETGGVNLYGYVSGNPMNTIDSLGLADCPPKGSDGGQPTIAGVAGSGLSGAGMPTIPKPGALGSIPATSPASVAARSLFAGVEIKGGIPSPTITNPGARAPDLGSALGRTAPLVGAGLTAYDIASSSNPVRAAVANLYGTIGATVGGAVGGVPGALVGGALGYQGGLAVYNGDRARADAQRNNPFRRTPGGGL